MRRRKSRTRRKSAGLALPRNPLIYVVPVAGGEAKAIASGIAWDMQPRYSPNGKWIAFTSDRAAAMVPEDELGHLNNARITTTLVANGVKVMIGAHGQREGLGAHWEFWMFHQGGMTPMEALRSATLSGAQYLGMEREIGSLVPGKLANLLVLDRNPLDDVANSRSICYTVVNGRVFDAATMNEAGPRPRPREPFFFELPGGEAFGTTAMDVLTHSED